jgi:mannose-6-phosphate isomerase-like protein (cupin superfamily)
VAGRAFVVAPGEGRPIDVFAGPLTVKATGEDTGGLFSLLETGEREAGSGPPLHIHHDAAEAFFIIEGEYVMYLDEREVTCPSGSFVFIPAGMRHTFKVSRTPARKLNFYFPAAMVGFFDELSAAVADGDVDDRALEEIARKHSMEVVGAVPEGYV